MKQLAALILLTAVLFAVSVGISVVFHLTFTLLCLVINLIAAIVLAGFVLFMYHWASFPNEKAKTAKSIRDSQETRRVTKEMLAAKQKNNN